jgi:hypothetical protein
MMKKEISLLKDFRKLLSYLLMFYLLLLLLSKMAQAVILLTYVQDVAGFQAQPEH